MLFVSKYYVKWKKVWIPGYRRRLLNLDCITLFYIYSKQKSNMKLLHFYCIESSEIIQDGNLRMHKKIARKRKWTGRDCWERGRAGIWERGKAGIWERGNVAAGMRDRGRAGIWERGKVSAGIWDRGRNVKERQAARECGKEAVFKKYKKSFKKEC